MLFSSILATLLVALTIYLQRRPAAAYHLSSADTRHFADSSSMDERLVALLEFPTCAPCKQVFLQVIDAMPPRLANNEGLQKFTELINEKCKSDGIEASFRVECKHLTDYPRSSYQMYTLLRSRRHTMNVPHRMCFNEHFCHSRKPSTPSNEALSSSSAAVDDVAAEYRDNDAEIERERHVIDRLQNALLRERLKLLEHIVNSDGEPAAASSVRRRPEDEVENTSNGVPQLEDGEVQSFKEVNGNTVVRHHQDPKYYTYTNE